MHKNTDNDGGFAVVETVENGRKLISTIPQHRIVEKILMWPDENAEVLIQDRSSTPSSKWRKIPCLLKRKSIRTFAEGEAEAAKMSWHTDSDSYQQPPTKKFRTKGAAKQGPVDDINYNEMVINQGLLSSNELADPVHQLLISNRNQSEFLTSAIESPQPENSQPGPSQNLRFYS